MANKYQQFRQLHEQEGGFLIPNPWDLGSAKMLQEMGAKAVATTSSGFAVTLGKKDGEVTLEEKLQHCSLLANHLLIPVNVDFEDGYADDPESMLVNIARLAQTGVAGYSIEDYSRDSHKIYDFQFAVERVQAAAESGHELLLTARAENLIRGINDLDDTIKRLQAFASAGADVLYAPGLSTLEQVELVCQSVSRPVNVLAPFLKEFSVQQLGQAGAKRISIGGALARAVTNYASGAATHMMGQGRLDWP
jgi:2-methylisocitrate lyase-like PEP mutase family enzyme